MSELTKIQKVILGIFTLLPFIFFPIICWQIFHFVVEMIALDKRGDPEAADILLGVFSFAIPIIMVSLLSIGLLIFYIVHAISNKKLENLERLVWVLLFVFFGIIAFPIYWLMRIWNSSNNPWFWCNSFVNFVFTKLKMVWVLSPM